jgi:hypothetical protein
MRSASTRRHRWWRRRVGSIRAVRDGTIPNRQPDGSWARPGGDASCSVCGLPITIVQMEFVLRFDRDGDKSEADEFHIHIRCFAAWELEQKRKR